MHAKSKRPDVPEPMALILNRQNMLVDEYERRKELELPVYIPPVMTPQYDKAAHAAASAWASWEVSDPFAYRRKRLHLRQGYDLPSDLHKEARIKLNARTHAKMVPHVGS